MRQRKRERKRESLLCIVAACASECASSSKRGRAGIGRVGKNKGGERKEEERKGKARQTIRAATTMVESESESPPVAVPAICACLERSLFALPICFCFHLFACTLRSSRVCFKFELNSSLSLEAN